MELFGFFPAFVLQVDESESLPLNGRVRTAWLIFLSAALALGCKSTSTSPTDLEGLTEGVRRASPTKPGGAPVAPTPGKVALVNAQLRYVILEFGMSRVPSPGQRFGIFRGGEKVGQVRISNEASGSNVAADVIMGDLRVGDEVRAD